jgi:hypothetical protein
VDSWEQLAVPARHAVLFDPTTGGFGDANVRRSPTGTLEIHLTIPPAGSVIVQTTDVPIGRRHASYTNAGDAMEIDGPWKLRFTSGGPTLPAERTVDRLGSWTASGGEDVKAFAGTAVYSTTFSRPVRSADAWRLGLGRVHESARVRLNGREVGVLIGPSFQLTLDPSSLAASNTLEIEVTNLAANRIAALDKEAVSWRKFYNVNFPARFPQNRGQDGLFSAAQWEPVESGLIGPVTLMALTTRF